MRSLPRSHMGSVWDCPSAAPSLKRMTVACGLPTTLRAAHVSISLYPPKSRHMDDTPNRVCGMGLPSLWRYHPLPDDAKLAATRLNLSHAVSKFSTISAAISSGGSSTPGSSSAHHRSLLQSEALLRAQVA